MLLLHLGGPGLGAVGGPRALARARHLVLTAISKPSDGSARAGAPRLVLTATSSGTTAGDATAAIAAWGSGTPRGPLDSLRDVALPVPVVTLVAAALVAHLGPCACGAAALRSALCSSISPLAPPLRRGRSAGCRCPVAAAALRGLLAPAEPQARRRLAGAVARHRLAGAAAAAFSGSCLAGSLPAALAGNQVDAADRCAALAATTARLAVAAPLAVAALPLVLLVLPVSLPLPLAVGGPLTVARPLGAVLPGSLAVAGPIAVARPIPMACAVARAIAGSVARPASLLLAAALPLAVAGVAAVALASSISVAVVPLVAVARLVSVARLAGGTVAVAASPLNAPTAAARAAAADSCGPAVAAAAASTAATASSILAVSVGVAKLHAAVAGISLPAGLAGPGTGAGALAAAAGRWRCSPVRLLHLFIAQRDVEGGGGSLLQINGHHLSAAGDRTRRGRRQGGRADGRSAMRRKIHPGPPPQEALLWGSDRGLSRVRRGLPQRSAQQPSARGSRPPTARAGTRGWK